MNSNAEISLLPRALRGLALVLIAIAATLAKVEAVPPAFWTGPNTNYAQNPVASGQDVLLPGLVSLDRAQNNRLYNGIKETFHNTGSPTDTEWATATPGVIADLTTAGTLTYATFDGWVGGYDGFATVEDFIVGRHAVLHLINENIYISIEFSAWGAGFSGGFAYARSTPAVAAPTPAVSITNPVNNANFAAPANVNIAASASVSSGSVTNVKFFANTNALLGSASVAPFTITASNLAAGAYALTAVATAAGISATSAVVNITVSAPPTPMVSITNPAGGAVFAAPANVKIGVSASVSSGTITNVAYFNGSSPLGSAQSAPFSITASNLSAGAYQLKAVATAAGVSGTSAVVNVSVVNPAAISNSAPIVTNGQFSFSYSANPGLTYVVQSSSDLSAWSPVFTNLAATNPVLFSTPFILNSNEYYRVGLAPNP